MPKHILLISLVSILLLIGAAWWLSGGKVGSASTFNPNRIIFFYGANCPHCQETEKWFEEQKVADKIAFERKEVSTPAVQVELQQAVKYCQFDDSQGIGVPFLFAEGKCYMGTPDVEGFFKQKLGLN
jgi:glutaredoxin